MLVGEAIIGIYRPLLCCSGAQRNMVSKQPPLYPMDLEQEPEPPWSRGMFVTLCKALVAPVDLLGSA